MRLDGPAFVIDYHFVFVLCRVVICITIAEKQELIASELDFGFLLEELLF